LADQIKTEKRSHFINQRIFIVGCERSGTTLLQSLLASHSQVTSYPETHFFSRFLYPQHYLRNKIGLAHPRSKFVLNKYLYDIRRNDLTYLLPKYGIFTTQYVKSFTNIFDTMTKEQGKTNWVEKTPEHINHVDYIDKNVKNSKFIHIIRNGRDVIASLYEVTHKHPKAWAKLTIDECIKKWINAIKVSLSSKNKDNHIIVKYENLISNPSIVITDICNFLNIDFEENTLINYKTTAENIRFNYEVWKNDTNKNINITTNQKFENIFSNSQKEYILKNISQYDLNKLFE